MDRKSSRSDEDLDISINSQVNGRIHGGPIVVESGSDQVILAIGAGDHSRSMSVIAIYQQSLLTATIKGGSSAVPRRTNHSIFGIASMTAKQTAQAGTVLCMTTWT